MNGEKLKEIIDLKSSVKLQLKDKEFKNLSRTEKDLLLESVCKILNLI